MDYWHSSQYEEWTRGRDWSIMEETSSDGIARVPTESVVYIMHAIDSLADLLPRFVRNGEMHYTAMVLAQRYISASMLGNETLCGETCANIACFSLHVAIASDGKSVLTNWDTAVSKVFPCEVVHKCVSSAMESGRGNFVKTIGFDLHVHHPFETLGLLLMDVVNNHSSTGIGEQDAIEMYSVAIGIVNSLYRTTAIVRFPPYLVAVAAITGSILITHKDEKIAMDFLQSVPVDSASVESILSDYLFPFVRFREFPVMKAPALAEVDSPSARTVSRQSSKALSGGSRAAAAPSTGKPLLSVRKRKRGLVSSGVPTPIGNSLAWALLPVNENEGPANFPRSSQGFQRPVGLSELKILRELSRVLHIQNIVKLEEVELYAGIEDTMHNNVASGGLMVRGVFDCHGTQFDSILRLLGSEQDLVNVVEQLVSVVYFLNENKICHYSLEPSSFMIVRNEIKLASLSTASILPSVPSVTAFMSLPYRAPELLLGTQPLVKDDPLAVDLWSLGCLVAEVARIFSTRNRYEDPLFALSDFMSEKPDAKCPVKDKDVYMQCRYVRRMMYVLNGGRIPGTELWPGITKRPHFENLTSLCEYEKRNHPHHSEDDLPAYLRDKDSLVTTEIVRALLRWSPEKRASPRTILQRIAKHKSSH